ncbi:hypothetical protein LMG29542_07269 [Paraburkholderia humisilvae]|uniref:Uncharacterized protein n=1 Tax=Paraburkholderia humisilvae TaxID=627669 RepID=A0A6J5F7C9_9BURK|nr:hypothetical protein LMG29542_07269 [Paraburkholderia humisilvae]
MPGPAFDGNTDIEVCRGPCPFNVLNMREQYVTRSAPPTNHGMPWQWPQLPDPAQKGDHLRWRGAMATRIKQGNIVHAALWPFRDCASPPLATQSA